MNPLGTRTQCPMCLRHVQLRGDEKLPKHRYGRVSRVCWGSGKTPEAVKVHKALLVQGKVF